MGWVEAYIDPQNERALWDGWVALVDKKRSQKFSALVSDSDNILPKMPWGKELEKSIFIQPDFTSLDIVMYSGDT